MHKFIVIFAVGLSALWGGSKERGHLPPGSVDGRASTVSRVVETVQSRSLPEGLSEATNVLAITDFAVDRQNRELAFGTTWASNLFDYTDSRRLYLFSSTNLRDGAWAPLGAFPMPSGTNSHAFTVASDDVDAAMWPWFLDALAGAGFFRFGLDFDSDGDGLTDAHERYWTFTDPEKADTDGDGLSDGAELSASIGTDPLLYDTDGDGVGDGDEIAVRSDPLSSDTDGDGLSDAAEIGTMAALTGDGFLWFDLSGGTRLMTSQTVDDSSWKIPLSEGLVVNNACYTNAKIHVDGTVHLLCPTNAGAWESACTYGSLGDTQYSPCHVTVALCGADLYARTNDWGSQILHGTAESGGRRYTVVEYRSVGLYAYRETNETLTCQLILPHDETNTVYVSYLCVSNTFREVDLRAGVQCGGMPSFKSGNACYNLTWPLTAGFPEDGLTIKYTIGAGSDPASPDTDGDGLSDSDEVLACRTNPLVADTDGDGLCDGEEVRAGTDPLVADTDGDGMPDGWEVRQGLDPLADDSVSDPDGDGLANLREYALGTSPTLSDTDGDGLSDREEVGWWEYADSLSLPEFDVSGGTNLLSSTRSYSGGTFVVPLPFTFRCAGYVHTNIAVGVCGMVGLMSDRNANSSFSVPSGNGDMESTRISSYHTAVAAYWDYLRAPANGGVQITVADVETNGCRYAVVEYANIRLNTQANNASCVATFQIVLPQAETNTVYVRYVSLSDGFDGSGATIGAQLPNRERTHQISYNTAGAITNGTVIAYHFGTGSDPTVADTDGDGMTDDWEAAHGLDPGNASGADGAAGDPDGDGLSNVDEYQNGCDPQNPDTDGDGVGDGAEVARGSNPADASDAGTVPDEGLLRELTFNINGDYAAWEMTIEGLGPGDARVRRITMGAPNALQNVPLRMRKGSSYRLSMRWLNSDGHTDPHSWYCWQAKIDGVPSSPSYRGYSTERLDGNEVLVGGGWVAENADGLLSAHVHTHDPDENGQGGGNVAEGLVATLHVLDDPELVPDMDRDGRIGEDDAALAGQGRPFRFWTNDDGDRSSADGDMARAVSDEFPANGLDWDTGKVNGRRDLVDYAAVWLNLKPVADSVPAVLRPSLTYRLRHPSGALNAVWSTMGKDGLASFFRSDMSGFGPVLDQASRLATKERIGAYGLDVPSAFVALAEGGGPQGVFWVDGRHASAEPLWIDVLYGSRVVCSNRLVVSLSGVEDMYRWMNMRGVCGAPVGRASALGVPANSPDAESDGRQFVFVHGYNVDETSARAWSAEMFKRLWQSGSRAMFTAVTWYGNDSQGALYLGNTPDYYSNVDHALSTAGAFGSAVAALPGTARYVAAHSLGNMMVSSAIAEHGLSVARYFMLNAAVPLEAYDPNAVTAAMRNNMTPGDWRPYALRLRAGHWHGLFGTADARHDLTWKGRFAAIANAVNYYSTDEDVLNNADGNPKDLLSPDYAWANQETRKGVWPAFLPGNNEAGWSFNADYDVNNPDYVGGGDPLTLHLTPAKAAQLTDAQLRTAPFFGAFDDMSICTTNQVLNIPQKNQLLADAIPAESYAAGRNPISNFLNRDMRGMKSGGGKWTHSFLVEAPYAWVYQVFDDMKMRSDQ